MRYSSYVVISKYKVSYVKVVYFLFNLFLYIEFGSTLLLSILAKDLIGSFLSKVIE